MIVRSLYVWFGSSLLLFWLSFITQADEWQAEYLAYAAFFAFPIGVAVYLGAVGTKRDSAFEYPAISICVLATWIFSVAPSLVVETPESLFTFSYSADGLFWGRVLFFLWCLIFVLAAGRPFERTMQVQVRSADFWALFGCAAAIMAALISLGTFSNYQSTSVHTEYEAGTVATTLKTLGAPLPPLLPVLCALTYSRASSAQMRWSRMLCFLLSCVALFLATSRTAIVLSLLLCLCLGRKLALQPRLRMIAAVGTALPILLLLVFAYRQSLALSHEGATSVSAYLTTAANSTGAVVRDRAVRDEAIVALSENVKSRLWYGQQFSTTVDGWLDHGAEWQGSFFAGAVRAAPTFLVPNKNELANQLEFEGLLYRSGRFPLIDLGPMPWQQWLFEGGLGGLLFGAALYGLLVRVIDRRLSHARSIYEVMFWFAAFLTIAAAEHTTDSLLLVARIIFVFLLCAAALGFGLRLLVQERERAS
jgi:hypothetical protein